MAATITSESLRRLVATGQNRGHLTTEDLASALPVAAMTPDEIALVVVHLEEAGVPVELDESLLIGRPHHPAPLANTPEIVLADPAPSAAGPDRTRPNPAGLSAARAEGRTPPASSRSAHWPVALAGLLVAALISFVLLLTG
jgi:hypothetical protein